MHNAKLIATVLVGVTAVALAAPAASAGQARQPLPRQSAPGRSTPAGSSATTTPPADYVIGPDDVLGVVFWRDKEMSAEVAVRPDGKISLPLLNDVQAAGLTPIELRDRLVDQAKQYVEDPTVTVVVRQINSRKVFVTGQVERPGPYPLTGPATVVQMLAVAGGLKEYADSKKIVIMRIENGRTVSLPFNYHDFARRKNLRQNIALKPGDTIIVP